LERFAVAAHDDANLVWGLGFRVWRGLLSLPMMMPIRIRV
jgi:hypothetical protein